MPGWSVVQSKSGNTIAGTTLIVTTNTAVTAGNKIIAAIAISAGGGASVTSLQDAALSNWTLIKNITNTAAQMTALYALDVPAGDAGSTVALKVTCPNTSDISMLVQEVSGLAAGNTLAAMIDGTAGTLTGSALGSTGSPVYASTAAGEYLVSVYGDDGGPITYTVPAGYTGDANGVNTNGHADIEIAYKNSTGGTEAGSYTLSGTATIWSMILAAFKTGAVAASPMAVPHGGRYWRASRKWRRRLTPAVGMGSPAVVPPGAAALAMSADLSAPPLSAQAAPATLAAGTSLTAAGAAIVPGAASLTASADLSAPPVWQIAPATLALASAVAAPVAIEFAGASLAAGTAIPAPTVLLAPASLAAAVTLGETAALLAPATLGAGFTLAANPGGTVGATLAMAASLQAAAVQRAIAILQATTTLTAPATVAAPAALAAGFTLAAPSVLMSPAVMAAVISLTGTSSLAIAGAATLTAATQLTGPVAVRAPALLQARAAITAPGVIAAPAILQAATALTGPVVTRAGASLTASFAVTGSQFATGAATLPVGFALTGPRAVQQVPALLQAQAALAGAVVQRPPATLTAQALLAGAAVLTIRPAASLPMVFGVTAAGLVIPLHPLGPTYAGEPHGYWNALEPAVSSWSAGSPHTRFSADSGRQVYTAGKAHSEWAAPPPRG